MSDFYKKDNWVCCYVKFGNYFMQLLNSDDLNINEARLLNDGEYKEYRLKLENGKWSFTYMFVPEKLKNLEGQVSNSLNLMLEKYLEYETPYIEELDNDF